MRSDVGKLSSDMALTCDGGLVFTARRTDRNKFKVTKHQKLMMIDLNFSQKVKKKRTRQVLLLKYEAAFSPTVALQISVSETL